MNEKLEEYVKWVNKWYEKLRGDEAATVSTLILPFFAALGYNVNNPSEAKPQHKAEYQGMKAHTSEDWAFFLGDSHPKFLVEAKAVGKVLDNYSYHEQLAGYYAAEASSVVLGILTTGVEWRFFTSPAPDHVMDKEPFLTWNILKGDAIPYDFLALLQRANFNGDGIRTFAKRKHGLMEELIRLLEPSDEFVKVAIRNLEPRTLTLARIQEWKPILACALQEWAQQKLNRVLDDLQAGPEEPGGVNESREKKHRKVKDVSKGVSYGAPRTMTAIRDLLAGGPMTSEELAEKLQLSAHYMETCVYYMGQANSPIGITRTSEDSDGKYHLQE